MLASPALSIITRFTFSKTKKDVEEVDYNDQLQVNSSNLLELAYLSSTTSANCTVSIDDDDHSSKLLSLIPTPATERADSSYLCNHGGGSGDHFYDHKDDNDHDTQCFGKLDEKEIDELQILVWELWRDFNSTATSTAADHAQRFQDIDPAMECVHTYL